MNYLGLLCSMLIVLMPPRTLYWSAFGLAVFAANLLAIVYQLRRE
jgi:hypothetical protein